MTGVLNYGVGRLRPSLGQLRGGGDRAYHVIPALDDEPGGVGVDAASLAQKAFDFLAGIEAGANDYLTKPIEREELVRKCADLIYAEIRRRAA